MSGIGFCQMLFLPIRLCGSNSLDCDYIDFSSIETALHTWDKSHLAVVPGCFLYTVGLIC